MFSPGPVYINGEIINLKDSYEKVSIFSPSFQYGLTIFEGIRHYKESKLPHLLNEHIKRLLQSCKLIGFQDFPSFNDVERDIIELIKNKELNSDIYIKYIVGFLGNGSWYSSNKPDRLCFYYNVDSVFRNNKPTFKKAKITSFRRISQNNMSPKIKCGANYINSRFGYLDVNSGLKNNEQFLPIFLDDRGFISESSGSTIFLVEGNKIITPSMESSILPSITRNYLLKIFSKKLIGYEVFEKNIDRWDIYKADIVFTVGTNIEINFISQIDYIDYKKNLKVIDNIFNITRENSINL